MRSEAANLADAPFGESLLSAIAWAYENAAERSVITSTSTSSSILSMGTSTLSGIAAGSVGAVRHVERYVNLIGAGATVYMISF